MSFVKAPPTVDPSSPSPRPSFNSQNTHDRLREGDKRPSMTTNIKKNRKSVFREVGLASDDPAAISPRVVALDVDPLSLAEAEKNHGVTAAPTAALLQLDTKSVERGCTAPTYSPAERERDEGDNQNSSSAPQSPEDSRSVGRLPPHSDTTSPTSPTSPASKTRWYAKLATGRRPRVRVGSGSSSPPSPLLGVSTMTMLALAVAVMAPTMLGGGGQESVLGGADAGVIVRRATSPTDVCSKWAQQSK